MKRNSINAAKLVATLSVAVILLAFGYSGARLAATADESSSPANASQDELERLLFHRPIPKERDGEFRIGVKCAEGIHAELTLYQAKNGRYETILQCPAVIGMEGAGQCYDGLSITPLGTWTVGLAYGIKPDPGSVIPYQQITDDMYWCGDGSSINYNKLIYHSDDPTADHSEDEHLIDVGSRYNYLLDMGYNAPCAPYCGSALFLHCWLNKDFPTHGCVGISEENMVKILQTITPGTSITIY